LESNNVTGKGEWVYIDKTGKRLFVNDYFAHAEDFKDGLARVEKNGKWGFINTSGVYIIPAQFKNCLDFTSFEND
jgi:hypothetical protein